MPTADIRSARGETVMNMEHVGSTPVEGLAANEGIDVDLVVADARAEETYAPALEHIDYVLTPREPSFHEHSCLRLADPRVNLHVWGSDCPEGIRLRMLQVAGLL